MHSLRLQGRVPCVNGGAPRRLGTCVCHSLRHSNGQPLSSRRDFLSWTSLSSCGVLIPAIIPEKADAEALSDLFKRAFPSPPQPILFPRKQLDIKLAVLLMRSSYDAVDELDYIPMDKFQILFWKLRQAEQEGYLLQYSPLKVRQGDLTDPLYFDYISYAQYVVIGREMRNGQQVFQEPCDLEECDFKPRTIRRDLSIADNKLLPPLFTDLVGDNILTGLQNGFRDEVFGAPSNLPPSASAGEVLENLQKILDIFVSRGFALKAQILDADIDSSGRRAAFKVKMQGSANLWGLASLSFRRSSVINNYTAMVMASYIRACGRKVVSYDIEYTDTLVEEDWVFE